MFRFRLWLSSPRPLKKALSAGLALALFAGGTPVHASDFVLPPLTYADLVDLADPAQLMMRVKIVRQAEVEPKRSPGLAPGHVRLYVTAKPEEVLSGTAPPVKAVHYLVDVPVGSGGRVPSFRGQKAIIFARQIPGHPEDLQLVASDAQLPAHEATVARLTSLIAELSDPGGPPRIRGIRSILSVAGNLAGESETQLFLEGEGDGPMLVSVIRRPGVPARWSLSWSELVDQAGQPPRRETLAWYRLACTLPAQLPPGTNLANHPADRARAIRDYALVRQELGECPRNRN